MPEKKKKNPDHITTALCEAYRKVVQEQIKGLKTTIKVSCGVATIIIAFVQLIVTLILLKGS